MKKSKPKKENRWHGLTFAELKLIAETQGWKCPITGFSFRLDEEAEKILDTDPHEKRKARRVCIDHDHETGVIRGLLSDMGNLVLGGFERGRYGDMHPSQSMIDYVRSGYATSALGRDAIWPDKNSVSPTRKSLR